MNLYLVWECRSYCHYGVVLVTLEKELAQKIINENEDKYLVIEEREIDEFKEIE